MAAAPPTPDIVCVGFAEWDAELWTNQQHLMSRLARRHRILFIESLGLRQPQMVERDVTRVVRRLRRAAGPAREQDGLHVLSPLVVPLHRYRWARTVNGRILPFAVRRAAAALGFERPILWAYVPQAEVLLGALRPAHVVYHCVDDIAAQPGVDAASFEAAERRLTRRADLVLASSSVLARRMRSMASNVIEAPNVADTALFATALTPGPTDPAIETLPAPRAVFTGAIVSSKLDIELIVELARLRRNWSFVFVGPVGLGDPRTDVSRLRAEPNVHLLGSRRYHELPGVLRSAIAGLIPYARNPLTDSIFPMKVYEYLAAGLAVIATPLPTLQGLDAITTAADARTMADALDQALSADSPLRRAKRSRVADTHSWKRRVEEIEAALTALPLTERRRSAD